MSTTTISWTDKTWNVTRGCRRVSPGCENCYAERQANRFAGRGGAYEGLVTAKLRVVSDDEQRVVTRWTGETKFVTEHLADPLRWQKPCRVFVDSMSDLFYEGFTNEQIAAVFGVMAACPQHTFQVLTKRAKRMREWFEWAERQAGCNSGRLAFILGMAVEMLPSVPPAPRGGAHGPQGTAWPLPNVWLGVSVEDQQRADERIPELLRTPAAVRFLSCEPLLGPLYLTPYLAGIATRGTIAADGSLHERPHPPLDWVIAGCESGPGARPCDVEWLRSLRDQCAEAGAAFFLKQARDWRTPLPERIDTLTCGTGSRAKGGGVIELPYLDGVQHAAFPEPNRG